MPLLYLSNYKTNKTENTKQNQKAFPHLHNAYISTE